MNDRDAALDLADLHTDPAVTAARPTRELVRALGREQLGVRIVELVHQPLRGFLVQGRGVEGVDEVLVDQRQHLIEDAVAVAGARLDHKPARDQRDEDQ